MVNKNFNEGNNTAVFTTKFVITDNKEITRVNHYKEDGAWEFFSNDHYDNFEDVVKIVDLGQVIKMDSTILDLADLAEGASAKRKFKGDTWIIEEMI